MEKDYWRLLKQKAADDSVIVSLLNSDNPDHGPVVKEYTDCCSKSVMCINVSKTKETLIDFRKHPSVSPPLVIENQAIEVAHNYKYLGTNSDDKLSFKFHVDAVWKKGTSTHAFFFF